MNANQNLETPLDLAPDMTDLERQVYTLAEAGRGIGTIMAATGRIERVVMAAYNKAVSKQQEYEFKKSHV